MLAEQYNAISWFILYWITCMDTSGVCGCRFEYESSKNNSGKFRGPSDSDLMTQNTISCTYVFQGNKDDRVKITFDTFNLVNGSSGGCNLMYIDVFQIDHQGTMDLKYRLCGSEIPEPFISVYGLVHLVFKMRPQAAIATQRKPESGKPLFGKFEGQFKFVGEDWQPFPDSSPECGEVIQTGVGGVLASPGYPLPYRSNLACTWMIKVKEYQKIVISYVDINMGQAIHCTADHKPYISMWNGFASPHKMPDEIKCGQKYFYLPSKREFLSATFRIVIRFETGGENNDQSKGFKLVWTAITTPKNDFGEEDPSGCPLFMCAGGESCIAQGVICNPLPRYCIDESLVCNGYANCASFDESDESGCWTGLIASASTIGGILLIILLSVTLTTCCKKRRLRRQLRRGNHDSVHYDPNDKIHHGQYTKDNTMCNGRKISVSYSPVRKLSSPGYIAVYSPDKKGYSVYDEYDSETCWNNKDKAHYKDAEKNGETYINHKAHAQHFSNHYENRESISREMQMRSPTAQRSPKKRVQNSPSGSLVHIRKSQYIACPTLPTPPESDPEVDAVYIGQTYMVVKDRMAMTQKNPAYSTMPRVNSKSVSAVV